MKVLIDARELEGVPRYILSDVLVGYTEILSEALFPKDSIKIIMQYLETKAA